MLITAALKEWSVAVEALAAGDTILLLRKGGIKEDKGRFSAQADSVILFPTFEHQKQELLKPLYQDGVESVEPGWHPQNITIKAWAQVTHIFLTQDAAKVEALSAWHIWQPQLAKDRLKWKAQQPLYVLALRTYRLAQPVVIEWQASYGGCRSWISLQQAIETKGSEAASADTPYQAKVNAIEKLLSA